MVQFVVRRTRVRRPQHFDSITSIEKTQPNTEDPGVARGIYAECEKAASRYGPILGGWARAETFRNFSATSSFDASRGPFKSRETVLSLEYAIIQPINRRGAKGHESECDIIRAPDRAPKPIFVLPAVEVIDPLMP